MMTAKDSKEMRAIVVFSGKNDVSLTLRAEE
jgi:hypothetical protein